VIAVLDISSNSLGKDSGRYGGSPDTSGVIAVANAISDMGALSRLIFGGDKESHFDGNNWYTPKPATLEVGMTNVDLSSKGLGASGAIVISAWLTHKDDGALSSINVEKNNIPANKEEEIYQMVCMNKLNIALDDKSLTELDVSGIGFGAEGAKAIVQYISDNGALLVLSLASNNLGAIVGWTHHPRKRAEYRYKHSDGRHQEQLPDGDELGRPEGTIALANAIKDLGLALMVFDISNNALCTAGGMILAEALNGNQVMTELNISSNYLAEDEEENPDMSGIIALGGVIPDMMALTKLDISRNHIPSKQEGELRRICAASGMELVI
jgi:Ran GTPase-activating protein (RanGAP) involved in mRNA processing and transport